MNKTILGMLRNEALRSTDWTTTNRVLLRLLDMLLDEQQRRIPANPKRRRFF